MAPVVLHDCLNAPSAIRRISSKLLRASPLRIFLTEPEPEMAEAEVSDVVSSVMRLLHALVVSPRILCSSAKRHAC